MEISKPDFQYVWASGGANVLPSNVKIQTGWTAEVPPFQWENAIQNRQDNAIVHLFQKGISEWDAASNYYFTTSGTRSYVQGSDGVIYVAVQDSVGQNPVTDISDTYWKVAFADSSSTLLKSNNLSDVANIVTARQNLGVVQATTSIQGIVELATLAEMATGTSTTLVPAVATVMSLFNKRIFNANDFIRIPDVPGGLIIQWGRVEDNGATNTFPTPFGTQCLSIVATIDTDTFPAGGVAAFIASNTQFRIREGGSVTAGVFMRYVAIGY